jgi:hypothetical protein
VKFEALITTTIGSSGTGVRTAGSAIIAALIIATIGYLN